MPRSGRPVCTGEAARATVAALLYPFSPSRPFPLVSLGHWYLQSPPRPRFCRPFSAVEETSAFRGGSGSLPAPEPLTFSEGSRRTGVGTQQNCNPIKDMVSLGRGRLPSPAPGRPRTHWLNAKQGAGLRARRGGSGRFRSRESGLGFHWESPAAVAAADPPALSAARPPSPGLASSSAKSRSERRWSAHQVVGAPRWGWVGRGVCPGSLDPGALVPRVERSVPREAS